MRAIGLISAIAVFTLTSSAFAAPSRVYADAGPLLVEIKSLDSTTQVVVPMGTGTYPLIVASHGWSASSNNQIGWAKHFASHGFVVAVPDFPSPVSPNTATNAGIIKKLVTDLTTTKAAAYKVKAGAFGLEGHSAGGLATTVASAALSPAATVLFDPVDKNGDGKNAYATLCAPVLSIFAESGSCNQNAEWTGFAATTKADSITFKVKGSTHCDGENSKRTLCGPFCGGGADPDRQAVYGHYATAFFLSRLANDNTALAALADTTLSGDTDVANFAHAPSTCGTNPNDAGATPDASTKRDSSTPGPEDGDGDGGATGGSKKSDAGGSINDVVPAGEEGGGCSQAPGESSSVPGALALVGIVGLALTRRRRSESTH